jgi:Putative zinc finger in N-recognin (UBR box)
MDDRSDNNSDEAEAGMIVTKDLYCTFAITGPKVWWQPIYACRDCDEDEADLQCICEGCADTCHVDHDVEYIGIGPSYCDCGTSGCCRIADKSRDKAGELNVSGLNEPSKVEHILEPQTYRIPGLDDEGTCQRLIQQAVALTEFPRDTFWIDANHDGQGLCELEQLALCVFQRHASMRSLENLAGAEWWVQVKDLSSDNAAVDLHYDKDENLAQAFGLGCFPMLSTVTYLTENSYPTLVFPHRHDEAEDEQMESLLVSHPRRGKHLAFDGRLLHGAPASKAMCLQASDVEFTGIRVTFLVNVWQHAKPCGINALTPSVRGAVKQSVETSDATVVTSVELATTRVETLQVTSEEDLRPEYSDRIILPFVSKGATWVSDDMLGPNLVLVTFPPPPHNCDTVNVKFGPGMQAYLEYQNNDDDEDEEIQDSGTGQDDYV